MGGQTKVRSVQCRPPPRSPLTRSLFFGPPLSLICFALLFMSPDLSASSLSLPSLSPPSLEFSPGPRGPGRLSRLKRYGREGIGVRYSFECDGGDSLASFMETSRAQLQELQSTGQGGAAAWGDYNPALLKQMEELQRESQPRLDIYGRFQAGVEQGRRMWAQARKAAAHQRNEPEAATRISDCPFPPLGGPVLQV